MRRADRLFEIVQRLRGGRLVTAATLAGELEVSVRTLYRDIVDLQANGVPIDGAAGVGYILRDGYQMPPLMFSLDEIEALAVGARLVQAWAGTALGKAAAEALVKIDAVLPKALKGKAQATPVFAPDTRLPPEVKRTHDTIRRAIRERRRLAFHYHSLTDVESDRSVEPLALAFWGGIWTFAAWCETRQDFRTFRVDRMSQVVPGEVFPAVAGRRLDAFLVKLKLERPEPTGGAGSDQIFSSADVTSRRGDDVTYR